MTTMNTIGMRASRALIGTALAIGIVACGRGADDGADSAAAAVTDSAAIAPSMTGSPTMTDPQIAQIAMTANSTDSAHGAMAEPKATNAEVKDFARTMVTDHGMLNQQARDLATRLGLTPMTSDAETQLKRDADMAMTNMSSLTGAAFDKAYIDHEVTMHQQVLTTLDQTLIPGAQNAELKTLLQQARDAVNGHLERARRLQSTLPTTP
jgi:putative membrane protein